MNRSTRSRLGVPVAISLTVVVAACSGAAAPGQSSPGGDGSATASGGGIGWSRDYAGTTISAIGEATLNSQILQDLLPDFTDKTGIAVQLEQAPYDSVVQKVTLDASTKQGAYDVVSLPYEFLGAFAEKGWITPIDDRLAEPTHFAPGFDPTEMIPALWRASSVWRDKTYGAPSNSAVMMMFYRKDLSRTRKKEPASRPATGTSSRSRRPGAPITMPPSSSPGRRATHSRAQPSRRTSPALP